MYSMVLMAALTGSADVPDCHRRGGCSGCYGGCYGGCSGGCYGGGYGGCYGGGYGGCYGGGYGGCYGGGYGGCYGGGYGGCYGGCYGVTAGGCYGATYGGGVPVMGTGTGTGTGAEPIKGPKKTGGGDKDEVYRGPTSATLVVTLPADAKLRVDGYTTSSTSAVRRFTTPPLDLGKDYYYTLTAEVANGDKTEVVTKRVTVRAGEETQATLALPISTASAR